MKRPRTYADAAWEQGEPTREVERWRLLAEETPVPRRITMALDGRGLWGPEVDEALGVADPMVDWWEAGAVVPTAEQMCALANLTEYPLAFFYEPCEPMGAVFMCGDHGCQFTAAEPGYGETPGPPFKLALL